MKDTLLYNATFGKEFMDLIKDFIWNKTEFGIVGFHESATDSEHVNRVSIFVCDKEHDMKDLRCFYELKAYLEAHFPEEEDDDNGLHSSEE